jgi:predicted small secreted protein
MIFKFILYTYCTLEYPNAIMNIEAMASWKNIFVLLISWVVYVRTERWNKMRKRRNITSLMLLAAIMLTACSSSTTSGVDANITEGTTEEKTEETPEKTTESPASETVTEAETEEAEGTVTNTEAEETEEKETTAKETTAKETTVKETTAKETTKSETTKAAETTTAVTPTTATKVKAVSMDVKVSGTHYVGDTLAASDFTVTVNYSDGRAITNPAGFTASPLKLTGYNNTVTVTYESISKSVTVTAADRPAETEAKAEVPETTKAAAQPTTAAPTTAAPTTAAPTTAATIAPTTVAPTTVAPTTVAATTAAPVYESTYGKYSFREATDQIIQSLEADSGHDMKLDATLTKLAQAWADYLRDNCAGNPQHSINYGRCEYIAYIPQVYPGHAESSFRSEKAAVGGYVAMGITNHVSQFKTDSSITNIGVGISRSADGMFDYEDMYVVVIGVSDEDMKHVQTLFQINNPDALSYLNNPSEDLSSANYN